MTVSAPCVSLSGVQVPRILALPDGGVSVWGERAVQLAAMAGLRLDPWQELVLRESFRVRPGGRWSAFEVGLVVGRQNGKGSILEARELAGLFLLDDERLILHSAHEFKTAAEAFRRVKNLIEGCPVLLSQVKAITTGTGNEGIELKNGSRLRFIARSKTSGRGFTVDLNILDEAMDLSDEALGALIPTMSGRPNPQLWYASSAGDEDSVPLARVRRRGMAGGDDRLAYFEWSVDEGLYDPADRAGWAQANPALGIRIDEEFVAGERNTLSPVEFARERLGVGRWPSDGASGVIPADRWLAASDVGSQVDGPVAFAVEVAWTRDAACVAVVGPRADGLQHVEVAAEGPGTDWVVPWLVERAARWRPVAVAVDPGGPAGSLLTELDDAGLEVERLTTGDVKQACGSFYDAAVQGQVRHGGGAGLTGAVLSARRRKVGDAWAWDRMTADAMLLMSVSLAHHAFARFGQRSYDLLDSIW